MRAPAARSGERALDAAQRGAAQAARHEIGQRGRAGQAAYFG